MVLIQEDNLLSSVAKYPTHNNVNYSFIVIVIVIFVESCPVLPYRNIEEVSIDHSNVPSKPFSF